MQFNPPISAHERLPAAVTPLITTTDLKGHITCANAEFLAVRGSK